MTPKLQSMIRHAIGLPRMGPAIRASGINSRAGDKTEGDDPLVASGIAVGTEECNGDDEVCKR